MIKNIEIFDECPGSFMRHLCMEMKPVSFMPGDYICLQVWHCNLVENCVEVYMFSYLISYISLDAY